MKNLSLTYWSVVLIVVVCLLTQKSEAQNLSYGQNIAVFKKLKSDLSSVGILTSNLSDKGIEEIQRVSSQLGVKIFIAK